MYFGAYRALAKMRKEGDVFIEGILLDSVHQGADGSR